MITKNQLVTYASAVLTTALETEPDPFPESMAYLAMGMNLNAWEDVKHVLLGAGWVRISMHTIQLTDKGREVARELNAAMTGAKS